MAAGAYSNGVEAVLNGTIDTDTTATKMLLLKSAPYTYNPDDQFVSTLVASAGECDATGYTGGFGGAGRKAATVTVTEDTANNRVANIFTDLTWTALGGATNNTIRAPAWIREITNDAASIPIAYLQFATDLTTNGSDVLSDFDGSAGNVRWGV